MTSIEVLQAMLLESVGTKLAAHGFKKRVGHSFYKGYDWGKAAIHLSFIDHANDFDVTVDVAIRFDAVEDLVERDNKLLTAKEKKNAFSMGAELGNLVSGAPIRWEVTSDADILDVTEGIITRITNTAIPYIERYCDMRAALEALSGDDRNAWLHMPIDGERAKRAVALAWLLGDKQTVGRLIESKGNFLRKRKDFGLGSFEAFANSLGYKV